MAQHIRVIPASTGLPVVTFVPEVFENVSYSPALLLDGRFDVSFVDHADFAKACQMGFDSWFEEMFYYDDNGDFAFACSPYTWKEVGDFLHENLCRRYDDREKFSGVPSLPFRVGFLLGWLSALALLDLALATVWLPTLGRLVFLQKYEEEQRGYNPYIHFEGLYK